MKTPPEGSPGEAATVSSQGSTRPVASEEASVLRAPSTYRIGELLGRGGMGEVLLAEDTKLGRSVAIKRMRDPSAGALSRFLREVRIQALLDHPAIVPVHELGEDAEGRPFFTMKRLTGTTLRELLREGGASQQRLLRALVDVCLAIEYAHERRIIHRDLKPANIMLGDYGEVYVLDWGLARVAGEIDDLAADAGSTPIPDGLTLQGAILGTPGYMSPEQMRGEDVTSATDVYALGAILFEILTGQSLHPTNDSVASTLTGNVVCSPIARAPDRAIAPELDEACVRALASKAVDRPRARELADRIQRYLDGDRDTERRRVLAADQISLARAALASGDADARIRSMRSAGRAIALDPESRDAAALVTQFMFEPPAATPPMLEQRLQDIDAEDLKRQGRYAAMALSGYLLFVPVIAWIGVNDWRFVAGAVALILLMIAGCVYISIKRAPLITWTVVGTIAVFLCIAQMFSPIVIVPALAVGSVAALMAAPVVRPVVAIGGMVVSVVLPLVLEQLGVIEQTTLFSSSGVAVRPALVDMGPTSAPILITSVHCATVIIAGLLVRSVARGRRASHRALERQAWVLEQLLPVEPSRSRH
jgi:eukaryotic-like serine/threonine-protein kinase